MHDTLPEGKQKKKYGYVAYICSSYLRYSAHHLRFREGVTIRFGAVSIAGFAQQKCSYTHTQTRHGAAMLSVVH